MPVPSDSQLRLSEKRRTWVPAAFVSTSEYLDCSPHLKYAQIAVSCVGIAIPIIYLRRKILTSRLGPNSAPAPRRARGTGDALHPIRPIQIREPQVVAVMPAVSATPPSTSPSPSTELSPEDDFNPALLTAKAFGIATLLVVTGATAAVLGVKRALGVRDVCSPF